MKEETMSSDLQLIFPLSRNHVQGVPKKGCPQKRMSTKKGCHEKMGYWIFGAYYIFKRFKFGP